jgi:hypothetical protein
MIFEGAARTENQENQHGFDFGEDRELFRVGE